MSQPRKYSKASFEHPPFMIYAKGLASVGEAAACAAAPQRRPPAWVRRQLLGCRSLARCRGGLLLISVMTSSSDVGFAIIGTGMIADFHATALQEVKGAKLRAVYNRTESKAADFARKFGAEAETSLEKLLARPDIQAVCVTTPSGNHADVAIPALNAGKHVLCEKPLDITVERIDEMLEAARRNDRLLAAVFQSRFGSGAQTVKKAVDEGRFGRRTLCNAYIKWWRSKQYYDEGGWKGTQRWDGGGALMNQGIHAIDLLQWLVGVPAEVIAFKGALVHDIEVEDTAVAILRFPDGGLGTIEGATSCWPGFSKRIEISGDKGSVVLEDDNITFWKFAEEKPEDEAIRSGSLSTGIGGGASDPKAISTEGHRLQLQDLADAIREGRQPAVPGSDGRHAVAVIRAIYDSAESGRAVAVKR
jgi:UDP-N-acetyl-2-amino-2-deoxyglucuronate dehydrogenase